MNLGRNTEEGVDELTLADDIALVQPTDLSLSGCMHRLIALDSSRRAFGRPELQAGGDALLGESIILLDDVVHVRRSSTTTPSGKFTGLRQFGDRSGVRWMAIHIDDTRRRPIAEQCQTLIESP